MKKNYILILLLSCYSLFFYSCTKDKGNDCNVTVPTISQEQVNELNEYIKLHRIENAIYHDAGFYFVIDAEGSNKTPDGCSEVVVNYSGHLPDGKEFDRANNVLFNLNSLIPGWRVGLPLIKEGGIITLYLTPELAYGAKGVENLIPQNSVTIFKIELITVF